MAQQNINIGTFPDDPNADAIRTAFTKVQENFTELYSSIGRQTVLSVNKSPGAGITVNSPTGNVVVSANIACVQVRTNTLAIGIGSNTAQYACVTQSTQTLFVDLPANVTGISNITLSGSVVANYVNANISLNSPNLFANAATIGNATANTRFGNGTINATGNANVGNLGTTGSITVTGNITAGNANLGNLARANYVNVNNQINGNIGNFIGNIIAANANLGNLVTANFFTGDGRYLTNVPALANSLIVNGTSNVNIPSADGNVNTSVGGVANVVVITTTGANIAGTGNFTGNLTAPNIIGNLANGNTSISMVSNGNITLNAAGSTAELVITSTGINVAGTANVVGVLTASNISGEGGNITGINASSISSGTLAQARLANSSLTVNGTSIALGASATITANTTQSHSNGSYITGGAFNGGTAITWAVDAATTATASKVVAYDANANVSANNLNATQLYGNGINITNANAGNLTGTLANTVANTIANVGNIVTGNYNATIGNNATILGASGANLTNINASAISSGVLAQARLANSTFTINGTTVTLGGTSTITANTTQTLTLGSGLTGTSFNGGTAVTATVDSTTTATASKIVARDANANINGNNIIATTFIGSGANLTSVPAGNLSGTIPSAVLGTSTVYVGTTGIALNRASASQTLTGVSIDGSAGSATTAGTVTANDQPNINTVGLLSTLTVGNATANTVFGNGTITAAGNVTAGNLIGPLANGTSNVSIPSASGNVNITAGSTTSLVVTSTGVNVAGTLNATGVISGSGAGLVSIPGANVTGTVPNANVATFVRTNTSANTTVYLLGTSTAANANITPEKVSGIFANMAANSITATTFNGNLTGNVTATTVAGNLTTAAQPNITSLGNLTVANVVGLANVGSLTVNGVSNLGPASNVKITGGTSGYYLTTDGTGNVSWAAVTVSAGTTILNGTSNVVVDPSGNVRVGVAGSPNVISANSSTVTIASNLISGNATLGNLASANYFNGTLTSASNNQPNINTLGTLTSLTVGGAAVFNGTSNLGPVGNVTITGGSAGYFLQTNGAGGLSWINATTLTTAPGSNTQVLFNDAGSFAANANLTFNKTNGNLAIGGNLNVTKDVVLSTSNISGVNVLTATNIAGTLTTPIQTNITSVGTLTALVVTGTTTSNNLSATNYANAKVATLATGTLTASNSALNVTQTWNNASATFTGIVENITDTASATNSLLLDLQVGGISKFNVNKAGLITGDAGNVSNVPGSVVTGQVANALVAGTVYTASQPAITGVGTITTGIWNNNIGSSATFAAGLSGANLASLNASNISSGTLAQARLANSSLTVNGVSIALGGTGTITANTTQTLTLGSYLTGTSFNGGTAVTATVDATTTSTASKVVARDANANIYANNAIFSNVSGNGAALTSLNASNITSGTIGASYVATLNQNTTGYAATVSGAAQANITSVSDLFDHLTFKANGNITLSGANSQITGANLISATNISGTLAAGPQTGINAVGTLSGLVVSGSISSGNITLTTNSNVTLSGASSQITGANLVSASFLSGNGVAISGMNASNITSGTIGASYVATLNQNTTGYAATVSGAAQANITSVSDLFDHLTFKANGNITLSGASSQITGANLISATNLSGTLAAGPQTGINAVGSLTGLTLTTNSNITLNGTSSQITGANLVSASFLSGNGVAISGMNASNITSGVIGASYVSTLNQNTTGYAATVSGATQANITSVSDLFDHLTFKANGNITLSGASSQITGANSISASFLSGNGVAISGMNASNITSGTIGASYVATLNQNTTGYAATVSASTQPNITSLGTLSSLAVTSGAATKLTVTASAAPTADMVIITNAGQPVTTANVNAIQVTYAGGAAAVESSAQQIDLTPGGTTGGTWNGYRMVAASNAASGVVMNALKIDALPAAGGAGTENAIYVGANWDNIVNYNGTSVIYGNGFVNAAQLTGTLPNAVTNAISNVGTVTAGSISGSLITGTVANASLANVANYQVQTAQSTGTYYFALSNAASTGNVSLNANTNVNVALATGTINATALNITGNANVGNIITGSGTGGNITGANNITANTFTGNLTTAAQPNITSVGTLTSLAVTGNITSGNANVSGQLISRVATGTAPFVVNSTTTVANLSVANATYATSAGSATTATTATSATTFTSTTQNSQFNSVGVGTAGSGVAGEIRATNNITAYYSSDSRLKENIRPIENALDKVNNIGGKTFDWTDAYINDRGGEDGYFVRKSDFGVVAQDVQRVFPLAVRNREDGTLAVDYEKLSALSLQAIVELTQIVNDLKNEIDSLKGR